MTTIKSYSDLQQSKKLAEILPLESADMCWQYQKDRWVGEPDYQEFPQFEHVIDKRDIACWSLSALLKAIPFWYDIHSVKNGVALKCDYGKEEIVISGNAVDACYEMIIRLNELKML